MTVYDHTDAQPGRGRMLLPTQPCPDPFAGLEPGDLTHVPADWKHNPFSTDYPLE